MSPISRGVAVTNVLQQPVNGGVHTSDKSVLVSANDGASFSSSTRRGIAEKKRLLNDGVIDRENTVTSLQIFIGAIMFLFGMVTVILHGVVMKSFTDKDPLGVLANNLEDNLRNMNQGRGMMSKKFDSKFDMKNNKRGHRGLPPKRQEPIHLDEIGEKSEEYWNLRKEYDKKFPPDDIHRLRNTMSRLRERNYTPIEGKFDCPDNPPKDYPHDYPIMDILDHWPPDDTAPRQKIFQSICVFDYITESFKAENYRKAEVPFVIRDDPAMMRAAERWADPNYLRKLLPESSRQRAEYSHNNHFMYWNKPKPHKKPVAFKEPTEYIKMSYPEWLKKANVTDDRLLGVDQDHWYFRLIACGSFQRCRPSGSEFMFDELPFFRPVESLYVVDPMHQMGVHCRFGMKGVIAENHFDASRNMIAVMGGERRYIISDPANCPNMYLYPKGHPSARHSEVDWSSVDQHKFPKFPSVRAHEIVLQAGDALYLPTNYFHYIISLGLNYQCNTRSGQVEEAFRPIRLCGFK